MKDGTYTLTDSVSNYARLVIVFFNDSSSRVYETPLVYVHTTAYKTRVGILPDNNSDYYARAHVSFSGTKMTVSDFEVGGFDSSKCYIGRVYGYKL